MTDRGTEIVALRKHINKVRARIPKRDVPAAMMLELDELEEQLEKLLKEDKATG